MTDAKTALEKFSLDIETQRECVFYEAWQGECDEQAVSGTFPPLCEEHKDEECHVCGGQATTQCGNAGQFVCGYPLCETCECANHGVTGHGAGRDFVTREANMEDQDNDIVEELLDDTDEERTAKGTVETTHVELSKERYTTRGQRTKWKVKVEAGGDVEKETFDDAVDADEYFEVLRRRYDLEERS